MRIHPLTRIVAHRDNDQHIIECRIEFFDRFDHSCKAVGQVRIDLRGRQRDDTGDSSGVIETWHIDLRNADENDRRYDPIMQTYLFRLAIAGDGSVEPQELQVYYLGTDGRMLQETSTLRWQADPSG